MPFHRKIAVTLAAALLGATLGTVAVTPAEAASRPVWTKNCTQLNKKYPHGVGKVGAKDHVTHGARVTDFTKSNKLYRTAMSYNRGLDRDHDGIACEKA